MRPNFVAVYLIHKTSSEPKYLILKRGGKLFSGIWQIVTGKVEKDENIVSSALREVSEETGLLLDGLFSVDIMPFYDRFKDELSFSANFCMFVENPTICLSDEHTECEWVNIEKARDLLSFPEQIETLNKIHIHFVVKDAHGVNYLRKPSGDKI